MKPIKYLLFFGALIVTIISLKEPPSDFEKIIFSSQKRLLLDRNSNPLLKTYAGKWNEHQVLPLQEIPPFIKKAIITAEDKRFFKHWGVDWFARLNAIYINLKSFRVVRGASTITEQVVRMIHPRPRSFWSRWLETIEAYWLEKKVSKSKILEFYLNQVPFASNRRGVVQASSFYFDRTIDTLTVGEILALACLLRSPSRLELYNNPSKILRPVKTLAKS